MEHKLQAANEFALGVYLLTLTGLSVHEHSTPFVIYKTDDAPGQIAFSPDREFYWKGSFYDNGQPVYQVTDMDCDDYSDSSGCVPSENAWWSSTVLALVGAFFLVSTGTIRFLMESEVTDKRAQKMPGDYLTLVVMLALLVSGAVCWGEMMDHIEHVSTIKVFETDLDGRYYQSPFYYFIFASIFAPTVYVLDFMMAYLPEKSVNNCLRRLRIAEI